MVSKPAHPVRKRKKCRNGIPGSEKPNSPLETRVRAVDWCWEYSDICWKTARVWAYMRWRSQRGMGHKWVPQDSPAAGVTRYGHYLTRRRMRRKTGRRTRLWRCIVELKSSKFQESSSSPDGDVITSRFFPHLDGYHRLL